MKSEKLFEKIEAYLAGEMNEQAIKAFEKEIKLDKNLQAEVALHQQLHSELGETDKLKLRQKLNNISKNYNDIIPSAIKQKPLEESSGKGIWMSVVLGLLGLAGLLFMLYIYANSGEKNSKQELPKEEIYEEEAPLQHRLIEQKEEVTPQANNQINEDPAKEASKQIATLNPKDFALNPFLENQVGTNVRGEDYVINIESPAPNSQLKLKNGQVTLKIKGTLKATEIPAGASFMLTIFSNKVDDYNDDKNIMDILLNLQPLKGKAFPFQFNANIPLEQGLYYYVISEKEDDEPLYVGKIEVK